MKNKRTCAKGHVYFKSSDCPTCPVCANENKPAEGFFAELSAPARRALQNNGINTLEQLAGYSKKEILAFHGMGPASIPSLTDALKAAGLSFKK